MGLMWEHICGFEEERGECVRNGGGGEVAEVRGRAAMQGATGHSKNVNLDTERDRNHWKILNRDGRALT